MAYRRRYLRSSTPPGIAFVGAGCSPTPTLANPNVTAVPPPAGTAFAAGAGKTLTNIHVQLIFWGAWWNGNPLAAQVEAATANLLAGPYMSYCAQYGVRRGRVRGTTFAPDSEPGTFTATSLFNFLVNLLDNDRVPEPDEDWPIVYAVIMPANAAFAGLSPPDVLPLAPGTVSQVSGFNTQLTWGDYDIGDVDNGPAYYLWAGNDGTLDYITTVLSHELVELATDPNGSDGVRQVSCAGSSCQIGDPLTVCQGWCDHVRGVKAQAYWSILDGNGALPKLYSVRRTLAGRSIGGKLPRPLPSANAWISTQF
jgi:hypothetical protein